MVEFILYVSDQNNSAFFYEKLLRQEPVLQVPGMTEFLLNENCKLGLMPDSGIAKIICPSLPHPNSGNGIPRCELYIYVDDIETAFQNAVNTGAILLSTIEQRNWGDKVCYFADLDGHVIAFAQKT